MDLQKLLELYPMYTQVYGPYIRKDGRKHLVLYEPFSKGKKTISFPKAIMEVYLGHKLVKDDTVDHIDRDKTNDAISNLQVINRKTHASLDAIRRHSLFSTCPICKMEFELTKNQLKKRSNILAGPFCSKTCAGKYGKSIQLGEVAPLPRITNTSDVTYYRQNK